MVMKYKITKTKAIAPYNYCNACGQRKDDVYTIKMYQGGETYTHITLCDECRERISNL